ncbi:hypothetical protein CDAR_125491 [Caerostris darwini]|uniref:Uncharacterized protein n=1 Tax=Caerostris darwini TaxID=1538125 RepID=A0AAV4X1T0_9ARAC|nr:hypothetical protein CDAR_125491 [Caerostris darwini]
MSNRQEWRRKALHAVVGTTRQTHSNKRIPQKKRKLRDKDSGRALIRQHPACFYVIEWLYPTQTMLFFLSSAITWQHKFRLTCHLDSQCLKKKANEMNNRQEWRRKALHDVVGTTRQTHHNKKIPQKKRKFRDKESGIKVDDIAWHTAVIA